MENSTDSDYNQRKGICEKSETKNLDEYHDLYLKNDTLHLADALQNFRKMGLEVYELDLAKFVSAPGLLGNKIRIIN